MPSATQIRWCRSRWTRMSSSLRQPSTTKGQFRQLESPYRRRPGPKRSSAPVHGPGYRDIILHTSFPLISARFGSAYMHSFACCPTHLVAAQLFTALSTLSKTTISMLQYICDCPLPHLQTDLLSSPRIHAHTAPGPSSGMLPSTSTGWAAFHL